MGAFTADYEVSFEANYEASFDVSDGLSGVGIVIGADGPFADTTAHKADTTALTADSF